ncbi:MAG TPA: hypothetical protein VOA87_09280, partial [Thermoanaerobaculia bacterium]|nr:hypothetical protein [Thermoanaerobaculia bacterium]
MSLRWLLLAGMLFYAAAGTALWNRLFRPRLAWGWAALFTLLALAPLAPALSIHRVYGPFDTNAPHLPWADREDLRYSPKNGRLNDATLQFAPWQAEARRQMLALRAPLLNPWSGAGQPLLGNGQAAPFSLVSLLSLPFDPREGQALRAFLKVLLALTGTFLAARQLGCHPMAALAAAVAYAFGGSLAVWQLFPHAEVMALWPFAFLASERLLAEPADLRARALLVLALGGLLLAGHPETAAAAGAFLAARWLFALAADLARRRAVLLMLGLAFLAALGTSFFTLPVAQTILGSEKVGGGHGGWASEAAEAPAGGGQGALLNLVVPGVFGTPQGAGEAGPAPLQWMGEGSVGLAALVLALAGLAAGGWRREMSAFLALAAAAALAVHLDFGGLFRSIFDRPPLSLLSLRYVAYLGGFAVALLAALALQLLVESSRDRRLLLALAIAAAGAGAAALAAPRLALRFWAAHGGVSPAIAAESARHAMVAAIVVAGLALVVLLRRYPLAAAGLAAVLVLGQLLDGYGGYVPTVPAATAYPPLPLLDLLARQPPPFRLLGTRGVFVANASTFYGLADVRTHDPTEPARYVAWLADFLDLDLGTYKKQYRTPKPQHLPFLRLLGVRYLLAGPNLRLADPWVDRGLFRQTRLWELSGETRWAFFPAVVVPAASAEEARAA